jgi:thiamine pyrophosphate-dependent acetolactate synthase large subunit-like protein
MTLGQWLAAAGVRELVGDGDVPPIPGLPLVVAPDQECAALLAEAAAGYGSGLGARWDGSVLTVVSRPPSGAPDGGTASGPTPPVTVDAPDAFAAALAAARRAQAGQVALRPTFDLGGDGPTVPARPKADPSLAPSLPVRPLPEAGKIVVDLILAGRGVIRAGAVPALRELAERTGLGVLNTFTSKGMFRWDSPFHLGTGCLQSRDLELAGVHPGAAVLAVGVDADECPPVLLRVAGVESTTHFWGVDSANAAEAARRVARRPGPDTGPPALYRDLAAIAQPLYTLDAAPLNPARAAADTAEALPDNAAVFAEPGLPGLWLARSLPTTRLGSARVPSAGRSGFAVAGALIAGLRGELGIAVVDAPPTGPSATLLDLATKLDVNLVVAVWGPRGGIRSAADHRARLAKALATPGVHVVEVPVDFTPTERLVAAAGGVAAWPDADLPLPR